jgi:lipopolysaccharide biosynthesis regulator YciM
MRAPTIRRGAARLCLGVARQLSRRDRDQAALQWVHRATRVDGAWAEPWVAAGALHGALGHTGQALEAFMGANARDPQSRVIVLMLGMALDELHLCDEAYEWLVRAAHASRAADESVADGHPDSLFWRELGLYCVCHGRDDEAIQTAALAELYDGWSGGVRQSQK